MHIAEANLTNLTSLWEKYGSLTINRNVLPLLRANTHWPHRCWLDWRTDDIASYAMSDHSSVAAWLKDVPESVVLSIWPIKNDNKNGDTVPFEHQLIEKQLLEKKWKCAFEQLAMYIELQEETTCLPVTRKDFQVVLASTSEDVKKWVDIGSEAFGYSIDLPVVENLINDKSMRILLGYQGEQAVASALLYKTGKVIGLHQVGVKQAFQGQGIAKYFMQEIISTCVLWQGEHIVLQASQAGQPLYDSLGFKAQFTIKNYQRV
ncbi:hypothetical protein MNBD_GAMMA05-536 [hydrothermal vent metagenome]|uniref:N-acetyltransferase domain-containing protein n=1 Tax=hydrothermal vent metagenome TaxID=652676 RepID=A0A3B0WKA9_9ZZZZ